MFSQDWILTWERKQETGKDRLAENGGKRERYNTQPQLKDVRFVNLIKV